MVVWKHVDRFPSVFFKDTQTKLSNISEECFLHLLQIRIYLSMFRLGSNYTVQVY